VYVVPTSPFGIIREFTGDCSCRGGPELPTCSGSCCPDRNIPNFALTSCPVSTNFHQDISFQEQPMPFRLVITLCLLVLLTGCATTTPSVATTPEALLAEGDQLIKSNHFDDAVSRWKRVKEGDYSPELIIQAELKIADAQFDHKDYIEAAASYENFRKLHPNHEKAGYALYRTALCNFNQINGYDTDQTPVRNTVSILESFLKQYPASPYAEDAGRKLKNCRELQLRYELYVARFYYRTGKYFAATGRLEAALLKFPDQPLLDEVLFRLGQAYLMSGDTAKGTKALSRLFAEYPASPFVAEGKKLLK
jgi:outer membrane protein assembly factor BamD